MENLSFAMSTNDVTNTTVLTVSVGMMLELEFYMANMDKRSDTHTAVVLNISTLGTLLV